MPLVFRKKNISKYSYLVFEDPIRSEIFSATHLERHGASLAEAQNVTLDPGRGVNISVKLIKNERLLRESYRIILKEIDEQRAITPAAEWLVDNFHIIEEQIKNIRFHLPLEYYWELPKLSVGPLIGYPRIYGIAWAFVAHNDSLFDLELLKRFVKSYQKVQPLTIGELWAISITIQIVMIENLRRIASRIVGSQTGRSLADKIADELLELNGNSTVIRPIDKIIKELNELPLCRSFAVQLIQRLRSQDTKVLPLLKWLDDRLLGHGISLDKIVMEEHASLTAANATVRNIITSMRLMSAFDWRPFFEEVSLVDEKFKDEPTYSRMDFITRDRYRHGLEKLARAASRPELFVAQLLLDKTKTIRNQCQNQVTEIDNKKADLGYYLISSGRYEFEHDIGVKITFLNQFLRWCITHAQLCYLGSIFVLTLLLLYFCSPTSLLWAIPGFFVALDISISLLNYITLGCLEPRHLPRLELASKIPSDLKTFVVVPTLFHDEADIIKQIDQLEVHYLSNPDGAVHFALLSDWTDADHETVSTDLTLLNMAFFKIKKLNLKYGLVNDGENRFYIFHRKRIWNEVENTWMGWERKRGKIHEFNLLLRGAKDTTFLDFADNYLKIPMKVRYVVTLDADTKLPKGSLNKLVGTLAHPLNQARFDTSTNCVKEGYGILQPRITSALPSTKDSTIFQRLYAGSCGIDPYTSVSSDVYQDLFGEGSYTGKGIYEVDVFEQALKGRIPENRILSHDLFEGIFARCGLISDVEFFEDYPSHSEVAQARIHRWTRGDWQLLPWICGREGKNISLISRWKMFDNLRRSLNPPLILFLLVLIFTTEIATVLPWILLILVNVGLPSFYPFFLKLISINNKNPLKQQFQVLFEFFHLGSGRFFLNIVFIPHHSGIYLDAILRTLFRLIISKRKLLEWTAAAQSTMLSSHNLGSFLNSMIKVQIFTSLLLIYVFNFHFNNFFLALGVAFFWLLSPFIAWQISIPASINKAAKALSKNDIILLRDSARKIWRFFTTFVTERENFLPPDNFQEDPNPVVAHRSSPTNFGLYLLSVMAARDFGWIGILDMVKRLELTLEHMQKLPRYNGHFYNWYETTNLQALEPRYISSVDNGNLAGHLLTLAQGCEEMLKRPVILTNSLIGIQDTFRLFKYTLSQLPDDKRILTVDRSHIIVAAFELETLLLTFFDRILDKDLFCNQLLIKAEALVDVVRTYMLESEDNENNEILNWAQMVNDEVKSHVLNYRQLIPWDIYSNFNEMIAFDKNRSALGQIPLGLLSSRCTEYAAYLRRLGNTSLSSDAISIIQALEFSASTCDNVSKKLIEIASICRHLINEMNFNLLYDKERKLFSIGLRVSENLLDTNHYDLFASEARLLSFVAIAKNDVDVSHWFRLNRSLVAVKKGAVLASWSGSMFEYIMPALVMNSPHASLLEQTNRLVVENQIKYAQQKSIPWGISESAYNIRDIHLTYQYSNFGIPALGFKRGLGKDLVIAPYATFLAAMINPMEAVYNLKQIQVLKGEGIYGFYESLDFTKERLPEGASQAVVKTYMAHHQGMSLVSIVNVLFDNLFCKRFHQEPIVKACELLLQERVPTDALTTKFRDNHAEVEHPSNNNETIDRHYYTPNTSVPRTHLLSNNQYVVMITTSGSGYSHFKNISITRWREDVTLDCLGSYIYFRDIHSQKIWSAGFQPTCAKPESYEVVFTEDRACITRVDNKILSRLEVFISPEDNVEIRRVTLTNNGLNVREIEITSYAEVVLNTQQADVVHSCFSNLFVQTEYCADVGCLIATRRPRSKNDESLWMAHVITADINSIGEIEYETDRARFIGRGRSLNNPVSIVDGRPLSNTVGAVLDPITSLRKRVIISSGATVYVTFSTIISSTREDVLRLADKYRDIATLKRASNLVWIQAKVVLHYLGIRPEEANLFQQLANRCLYMDTSLRPSGEVLKHNVLSINYLWHHGISGDNPIVLVRIDDIEDKGIIQQLLRAHEYWGTKQLIVDLVILVESANSYYQDLYKALKIMVRKHFAISGSYLPQLKGKIFILHADVITLQEQNLLKSVARAVLVAGQGSLFEQVKRIKIKIDHKNEKAPLMQLKDRFLSYNIAVPKLEFYNGLGGFSSEGTEYVICLKNGQRTPAPWINVIANPEFGFHVSESGAGFSWSINSRENQITPWSNDPVCDPTGECFYIYDADTGYVWSPTTAPIRIEEAKYVISHGQGYSRFELIYQGIQTTLTQFVHWSEPVKISKLVIKNYTNRRRTLSVYGYVEWVHGFSRSANAPFIVTEKDESTEAIFSYNPSNAEFGKRISFATFVGGNDSFTCDRTEFIGRNKTKQKPSAIVNNKILLKKTGAGMDPCAALQKKVVLEAGQEITIIFLLGQTDSRENSQALIKKIDLPTINTAFFDVQKEWNKILGKIQVETPDMSMNIMLNRWLLYQTTVCRMWARGAFYQSGGAYGFRDQLQDSLALIWARPEITRGQIQRASARQFSEGDVQHWWHSPSGKGVRTHYSDDLLWLPFVVSHYIAITKDLSILDESVSFLKGQLLLPEQEDAYFTPEVSTEMGSIYEHCVRAIDKSLDVGEHGLPLMGCGDWNDGMNHVGVGGKGESVWLAWFLQTNLNSFSKIARDRGDFERSSDWIKKSLQLKIAVEKEGWDGAWYRRAYFDDGTPLGSSLNDECQIDSIAQTWGVISQMADLSRAQLAMKSVDKFLIYATNKLALLLSPPFDKTLLDPGYIKGYVPGIRENGGQYSHAAIWCVLAYAQLGQGQKAVELFTMLNPINHSSNRAEAFCYKVEPYVMAADIYSQAPHVGRGGWTWYTGSSAWMYRVGIETILGFKLAGDKLEITPQIHPEWKQYKIYYLYELTQYEIEVHNPKGLSNGLSKVTLDGNILNVGHSIINLVDDKIKHKIVIELDFNQVGGV
ncbi:MAG: hypothetical protein A2381_11600 [Bdellovibrionales bacterium RIFOXYB1_FULL_37_110]|nr:MAG: hypothetical protein A2417_11905 [Bdellovibrionales bacterium RIFOXYC1_FULL_37_79]OFZ57356.1 MAG: hypothetical protein A2381_11600 [Bdellovibrionales bacterium RIFOXYB1_FULL_37_110]OFZ62251.1 MAG: hypothetical protein A2577_14150 [Bdellovibrionales bacterium RIFOXYD1_FULL_36_51]